MSRTIALRLAAFQKQRKQWARAEHEADFKRPIELEMSTQRYLYDNGKPVWPDDPRVRRGFQRLDEFTQRRFSKKLEWAI